MPKLKKKGEIKNNVLRHCKINKPVEKEEEKKKEVEEECRELTTEEKESMKTKITLLEEHERIQLFHFIRMDNVKYTKKQNGILLNLKNANEEFIFKFYNYINKCIDNQKYRH